MVKFGSHTFALNALQASGLSLEDTLLPQNEARLRAAPGIGRKSLLILQEMARENAKKRGQEKISRAMTMLWLSRHEMTAEQRITLPHGAEVIHLNVTYPALGSEAASMIRQLAKDHSVNYVSGVFPAHIVAALMRQCIGPAADYESYVPKGMYILIPVSVPSPAREGEVRGGGFIHSHFEWVSV